VGCVDYWSLTTLEVLTHYLYLCHLPCFFASNAWSMLHLRASDLLSHGQKYEIHAVRSTTSTITALPLTHLTH
jgi:hypothetical protein